MNCRNIRIGRERITTEHWLGLFALDFLILLVPVLVFIIAVTPIVNLPPFIEFPTAKTGVKNPEFEGDITISVLRDGRIFFFDELVGTRSVVKRLRSSRQNKTTIPIIRMRIDRSAPFGTVRRIAIAARDAGYERVTIMVEPEGISWGHVWE